MAGMQTLQAFWDDLQVLKSMWLSRISGSSHKERMDSFYASQADAYDHFRARFLHGRERMLRACAKMIEEMGVEEGLLWVDLGGGTAENVRLMSRYIDLSKFEKIYVVDICGPLCDVARQKSKTLSWTNVEIVEADACNFAPVSKPVTLITFSYSLSSECCLLPFDFYFGKAVQVIFWVSQKCIKHQYLPKRLKEFMYLLS
eukprot:c14704_g1_i2 orf=83-685(+)